MRKYETGLNNSFSIDKYFNKNIFFSNKEDEKRNMLVHVINAQKCIEQTEAQRNNTLPHV